MRMMNNRILLDVQLECSLAIWRSFFIASEPVPTVHHKPGAADKIHREWRDSDPYHRKRRDPGPCHMGHWYSKQVANKNVK